MYCPYTGSYTHLCPEYVKADEKLLSLYEAMERGFQEYVHGENQRTYQEDYMVKTKTLADLSPVDEELARANERLDALRAENSEKDTALRKVQEVQRLTNNHVANLDVIISDLRHENAELGKTLTYLNGHEAVIFKVRRKLGQAFNRCYPCLLYTSSRVPFFSRISVRIWKRSSRVRLYFT